jgi:perosamine synthetase
MLTAIPRYGARVIPNTEQTIKALRARGELVQGPAIAEFERRFADYCGVSSATTASFGRMAFYYLLLSMDLPRGSEIVFPALTFWVIPELARAAGFTPVFADVDPRTFTLDPRALERAITPRTSAVVPTHLYGLPCDMGSILAIARGHGLRVIEDCAHALGATWQGQQVGTLGDAGFFSFQLLKPLNTYGGGMAVTNDAALAARVRERSEAEPWPSRFDVERRLRFGQVQRIAIRPGIFTWALYPRLWLASYLKANPDLAFWEAIRPLDPLPATYRVRYTNVQAAIGLEALAHLDEWTCQTIQRAQAMSEALSEAGVQIPYVPAGRRHVFYQYAIATKNRDGVVRRCVRHGIDVETLHVDVCTRLPLFGNHHPPMPGAEEAARTIQLPVHVSVRDEDVRRIAHVVRAAVMAA